MATLSPILTIAKEMLEGVKGKQLHVNEIAELAKNKNKNMGMTADELSRKLQSSLAANLKLKTQKSIFAKVEGKKGVFKRGWYRLKQDRSPSPASYIIPPEVSSLFTGKAGEYAVMGELLFWGHNVSMMSVDNGIDIVASKFNKYFNIQVKTAAEQPDRKFSFSIKKSSFETHNNSQMFYVFVLRRKLLNEMIIFPSSHLKILSDAGLIMGKDSHSISIQIDSTNKKYTLNNSEDVKLFVGNFGIIK